MKTKHLLPILIAIFLFDTFSSFAQTQISTHTKPVRDELTAWDPVRGLWLSNSIEAIAQKKPIPDRTFSEDFTPAEMYNAVPSATRNRINQSMQQQAISPADQSGRDELSRVNSFIQRPNCHPVMGRTYGDPHLASFDGASYSFQTVGEFILVKSASGNMEVQVRQRPQRDDFSLNTAVAMQVSGDRVCFYPNEKPDANQTTPLRINGEAVYIEEETYYLEHGGTIRKTRRDYLITWPTGETVSLDMNQSGGMDFMNIAVQIYPCSDNYEGILGNANGNVGDDFDTRGRSSRPNDLAFHTFGGGANDATSQNMEREYLSFLAKDFASSWRIEEQTSLFDYGFGQSTFGFTDETFPRVHHTLNDLDPNQRDRARRDCERQGIRGADLNGCIYDRGFLDIKPTPPPTPVIDRGNGAVLTPVVRPEPNVNPGRRPQTVGANKEVFNPNGGGAQPRPTNPNGGNGTEDKENVREPISSPEPTPTKDIETPEKKPVEPIKESVIEPEPVISTPKPVYNEPKPVRKDPVFQQSSGSSRDNSTPISSPRPVVTTKPISTPKPTVSPTIGKTRGG